MCKISHLLTVKAAIAHFYTNPYGYPAKAALWKSTSYFIQLRSTPDFDLIQPMKANLLIVTAKTVRSIDLTDMEMDRMAVLMDKYRDRPMDLADASLVAVAESLRFQRLFTLDGDFHIYRLADGSALTCVPY